MRNKRFLGFKFYRQYPIGPYIVDFCCYKKYLVIELDGGGHDVKLQRIRDKRRDNYLAVKGYKVLRVWNNELHNNLDGVVEKLVQLLMR